MSTRAMRIQRFVNKLDSFFRISSLRNRSPRQSVYRNRLGVERLEERWVYAAPTLTSSMPDSFSLLNAAPLQIPLDGADVDGDALTYTVSSDNPLVTATLHQGNRSLRIHVTHTGDGTEADPDFQGDMVFELFEDMAPRTTAHIIQLANDGFFDGIIFHRIIEDFVIQGGDPTGTGSGGSDLGEFDDEFNADLQHTSVGILSMAKSSDDTNDSQFFITADATRNLDFQHSVFGRLVEGEDIRQKIAAVPVDDNDKPLTPVTMTSVTLFTDTQNKVLMLKSAPDTFVGQLAHITVTVSDGNGGTAQKVFMVSTANDPEDNRPFLGNATTPVIPPIMTKANTPVTVNIPFTDVDGGSAAHFELAPSQNPDLELTINPTTGALTVTPKNGLSGVQSVFLGVRRTDDVPTNDINSVFDLQAVPIYISPAGPAAPDLSSQSDSGSSQTDNVTGLDNSDAAHRLQITVNGVVAGASVELFDGATLIGQDTVAAGATSITITTNGTFDLADGVHTITAKQTLTNQTVDVGNLMTTVNLASDPSAALTLTVDTAAPSITSAPITTGQVGNVYTYDVLANEEGAPGFVFSLIQPPTGAQINPTTGVISWVPSTTQEGNQTITVRASDAAGNFVDQTFTVDVDPAAEDPPVIAPIGNKTVNVGDMLTFVVTATDPDSPASSIRFSLGPDAPTGAAIDAITGVFTWTPTANQVGPQAIAIRASDGTTFSSQIVNVMVVPRPAVFHVVNGDLVIPGTAGNDSVTIRGTNVAGRLEIGGSISTETVDGVTGSLRVQLLGGNDRLTLDNVFIAGEIVLDLGEGDDIVRLGDESALSSAKNFTVTLGGGNDQIAIQRLYVGSDLTIDGGAGADVVAMMGGANGSPFRLGGSSAGATTIRGGDGDDSIQATYCFVVGPWKVEGGNGNDAISVFGSATSRDATVSGGDGNDLLAVDTNYFVTAVVLNGGAGSDSMLLKSSIVLQSATVLGGDGNDNLEVVNISTRGLMVTQGAGQDSTAVRASIMQNLFADLGDGNDMLVLRSNRIFGGVDVDGGVGGDRMVDSGNLMRGGVRKRRFEMFG